MTNIDPRIMNAFRRQELEKDPERSTIPAQRTPETNMTENSIEQDETPVRTTAIGRLATLAVNARLLGTDKLNRRTGGP